MAAPTIQGQAAAALVGYTKTDLVEHALNERGLTADAASTEFTPATAAEQAKCLRFVRDGIAHLFGLFNRWWPQREQDVTAEANASGTYDAVALPLDCGMIEAVVVGNRELTPLDLQDHLANLRPTTEGGGSYLTDADGDPLYYRLAVTSAAGTADKTMHVIVMPAQAAAFTARFFYKAGGQDISAATDKVFMPVVMHPLLLIYTTYRWQLDAGNLPSAGGLYAHLATVAGDVGQQLPAAGVAPLIYSVVPSQTAPRR